MRPDKQNTVKRRRTAASRSEIAQPTRLDQAKKEVRILHPPPDHQPQPEPGLLRGSLGVGGGGGGIDIGTIISQIAGGGVGGGVLMAIIGLIRSMMSKA